MPKTAYILAAMLFSIFSYGQQITFHKNVNYRANSLQQDLNKETHMLLLESSIDSISKVEIFNDNYSENIAVNSNQTKIDLKTLPYGNFVIQAKVENQWIIMYLEKTEAIELTNSDKKQKQKTSEVVASQQKLKTINNKQQIFIPKVNTIDKPKKPMYYWVVYESNSGFGSSKTMRLEYKDAVNRLISKNKRELKSNVGKDNTLIIYEVYNKSEFMNKQFRNPTYYKTVEASKFLNTKPLYASSNEIESDF
ncbi:hypothetical protein [Psychroserpens sp. S379A]|uniref:hypothetical protein n=1 Tax=Psychroserpens sp. S379A TaxID=3415137 RepID=UPI003C7BA907